MADEPARAEILTGRGGEARSAGGWLGRFLAAVVAVSALAAFAAILVYAYNQGREVSGRSAPVLVKAPPGPYKVRPESPGGMAVPDRDKEVYDRIVPGTPPKRVERLLPPPEEPVARPQPPAPAATAETPAPSAAEPAPPPAEAESTAAAREEEARDEAIAAIAAMPRKAPPPADPAPSASESVVPPRPAPAPPAGAEGPYRVQLAALRSEAAARRTWERLQRRFAELLADLRPTVERADLGAEKGIYYRLQAGPVHDRAAALRLCADLEQRKVGCLVVRR